ncbi:hypothetical protein EDB19DRAFT_2034795 [Suillus lakei]|nr:hypothetical protein EDB19DRAFT_2034795 [Suillus lakei]
MNQTDTDMDRAATQNEAITQTTANRTHTYMQCGRCRGVIEYDTHADWPTISITVNKHLVTCPAKFNFDGLVPSHPPSETHDIRKTPSPPHDFIGDMGANRDGNHDDTLIAGYRGKLKLSANRSSRTTSTPTVYALHPSDATGARRRSGSTNALGTFLDCGPNTGGPVKESERSSKINSPEVETVLTSISRAANSVANNVSRPMGLSDDEDLEEDDTPFSTSNQ